MTSVYQHDLVLSAQPYKNLGDEWDVEVLFESANNISFKSFDMKQPDRLCHLFAAGSTVQLSVMLEKSVVMWCSQEPYFVVHAHPKEAGMALALSLHHIDFFHVKHSHGYFGRLSASKTEVYSHVDFTRSGNTLFFRNASGTIGRLDLTKNMVQKISNPDDTSLRSVPTEDRTHFNFTRHRRCVEHSGYVEIF